LCRTRIGSFLLQDAMDMEAFEARVKNADGKMQE
jgi:hypothetical protein